MILQIINQIVLGVCALGGMCVFGNVCVLRCVWLWVCGTDPELLSLQFPAAPQQTHTCLSSPGFRLL